MKSKLYPIKNGNKNWSEGPLSYEIDFSEYGGPKIEYNSSDDIQTIEYDNFVIPKGTMIEGKLWALDRTKGSYYYFTIRHTITKEISSDFRINIIAGGPSACFHLSIL